MTRTTTHHITPTSQRWVRAHRFVAVIASFAALSACGESDPGDQPSGPGVVPGASPLAQSAGPGSPDAPPPTIPEDVEEMIDSITQTSLVPVLVQGLVSAGGHTWPIPATFFAQDLTAGDPIPVLTDCAVFGLGRGTRDSPTPTVMVGHQATLDRSAGDYVSFAYDGDVLTGGAYSHASGQEWAWSVRDVSVAYYPILDNLLLVDVSWAGDAGRTSAPSAAVSWDRQPAGWRPQRRQKGSSTMRRNSSRRPGGSKPSGRPRPTRRSSGLPGRRSPRGNRTPATWK